MRRSDPALALVASAIVLVVAAVAAPAHAYCRTSSCTLPAYHPHASQVCTPSELGDCGTPLFWAKPCVEWSLQKDASNQVTFSQAEQIVTAAFATWMSAPCPGGGTPRITVTEAEPAECHRHQYNQTAGNANIIMFHDDGWPYEGSANTLALTTVTYNIDTGEIYDADMELNSTDNQLTTGDTGVVFDLPSILTHEAGHFLGLAHSPDADATMFPAYQLGTTMTRDLSDDDIAGICAIDPPGDIPSDCDPTPRNGFSAVCAVNCSAAPATTCIAPGKGLLRLSEKTAGNERLKVRLTNLPPAVMQSQFGNPVTGSTAYAICIYDAADQLRGAYTVARAQDTCGSAPCWSEVSGKGGKGYKYGDKSTAAAGILEMKLIGSDAGKGRVNVIGKNTNGSLPTGLAALLQDQSIATVQLPSSDASCFGVTLTHVKRADGTVFTAIGP